MICSDVISLPHFLESQEQAADASASALSRNLLDTGINTGGGANNNYGTQCNGETLTRFRRKRLFVARVNVAQPGKS